MTFAAYEAGRNALQSFIAGGNAVSLGWPTVALLTSAALKTVMYFLIHRIARQASSPTLDAAAKDNLADVLTSIAAFAGTVSSQFIHPLADPIAGAIVSLWIVRAAFDVWAENLKYLTGGGASSELREKIIEASEAVKGVERVHQVITEHVGPELVADLHINVDGNLPLFEAHAISDSVQASVEALDGIDRAYVHLEPCNTIPRPEEACDEDHQAGEGANEPTTPRRV
jgi:cation diffusion facilitator family transporter